MKIIITGHTKGIGKALAEAYSGHRILGFSRSNGHDLNKDGVIDDILYQARDCDILFNNAYVKDKQTELFVRAVQQSENTNTLIVNICSKWGWYNEEIKEELHYYIEDKRKQLFYTQLSSIKPNRKILNVVLGSVDTDMTKNIKSNFKMDPNKVANIIKTIIQLNNDIVIQEIVLESSAVDWNGASSDNPVDQSIIDVIQCL